MSIGLFSLLSLSLGAVSGLPALIDAPEGVVFDVLEGHEYSWTLQESRMLGEKAGEQGLTVNYSRLNVTPMDTFTYGPGKVGATALNIDNEDPTPIIGVDRGSGQFLLARMDLEIHQESRTEPRNATASLLDDECVAFSYPTGTNLRIGITVAGDETIRLRVLGAAFNPLAEGSNHLQTVVPDSEPYFFAQGCNGGPGAGTFSVSVLPTEGVPSSKEPLRPAPAGPFAAIALAIASLHRLRASRR